MSAFVIITTLLVCIEQTKNITLATGVSMDTIPVINNTIQYILTYD